MAGLGFDAAVVDDVLPKMKDLLGKTAYVPAVVRKLFTYTPSRFRIAAAGCEEVYETIAYAVVIANCGTYAGSLRISDEAVMDDGLLDVIIFEASMGGTAQFVGALLKTLLQIKTGKQSVTHFKCTRVRIDSDPPVKMQLDGTVSGWSGMEITVEPRGVRLIVP
jgi:diacylglycerol kinase family enzyme